MIIYVKKWCVLSFTCAGQGVQSSPDAKGRIVSAVLCGRYMPVNSCISDNPKLQKNSRPMRLGKRLCFTSPVFLIFCTLISCAHAAAAVHHATAGAVGHVTAGAPSHTAVRAGHYATWTATGHSCGRLTLWSGVNGNRNDHKHRENQQANDKLPLFFRKTSPPWIH